MRPIAAASSTVRAEALGPQSFCHIDGLHSAEGTYGDMRLCAEVVVPGGLVALDDYFNQRFPGVSEGALSFERRHPGVLTPVAVGFNKVLFSNQPLDPTSTNGLPVNLITSQPTSRRCGDDLLHCSSLRSCRAWISTRSTPHRLVPRPESELRCAQPSSLEWSR